MKKFTVLQTVLLAVLSLIIGVLIALFVDIPKTSNEDLAGSIGKVDRFRNVKITEDDILLRNELVEDTVKRAQYEKYLLYYYYLSIKNASDVDMVLSRTIKVEEFDKIYHPYYNALNSFKVYLETARKDVLYALNLVVSLDSNENVPVITYLNQAQNAIARIRNHDDILMSYMNAIATFTEANPDVQYPELEDAHDILALNIMQSAILSQNKPVLSYLDKKKLKNEQEGMKELVAEMQLKSAFRNQLSMETEALGIEFPIIVDSERLNTVIFLDVERLQAINSRLLSEFMGGSETILNIPDLSDHEVLNDFMNEARLGFYFGDMENLRTGFTDSEQLRGW
ncbi:MAG: hypothetical protein Q8S18_00905 [Bacteroidales bacterium]|nr:hypothetical protein [Bacteroidales bacterium]